MKEYKLVKQTGAWYTYTYQGDDIKFQSKDFNKILADNEGLEEELYNAVCTKLILQYDTSALGIDDVELTDETIDDL